MFNLLSFQILNHWTKIIGIRTCLISERSVECSEVPKVPKVESHLLLFVEHQASCSLI